MMTSSKSQFIEIDRSLGGRFRRGLFWLLVIVILVYLAFPFYWALNSSLKREAQLQMTPTTLVPRSPDTGALSKFYSSVDIRDVSVVLNI